jgi:hypothetical protein
MEGAGLLKAGLFGNVTDAVASLAQQLDGQPTADLVLDFLERTSFTLQASTQGAGAHPQVTGKGFQGRPLAVMAVAQALMKPRSQAMLIAKTDYQPLRRTAQKYLEGGQVLDDWQAQVAAGEFDFRALGAKAQVGPPEQRIVAEGQARLTKVRAIDGNTPPAQPTQQADHQHKEGFLTKTAGIRIRRARLQTDHRPLAAHTEAAAKVPQEQPEVTQALAQGLAQVGFLNQSPTNQGKTADRHAVGIQLEELVL